MRLNLTAALVGLVLLAAGLVIAVGVGWAMVVTGAVGIVFGLFRDDGRETP